MDYLSLTRMTYINCNLVQFRKRVLSYLFFSSQTSTAGHSLSKVRHNDGSSSYSLDLQRVVVVSSGRPTHATSFSTRLLLENFLAPAAKFCVLRAIYSAHCHSNVAILSAMSVNIVLQRISQEKYNNFS